MRRSTWGRAPWLFTLVALVLLGGTSMYRDAEPGRVTRPGFTLFAVDRAGAQSTLAVFDGKIWRPPCDVPPSRAIGEGSAGSQEPTAITGLAGSAGAPLLRVRELTGESAGWEPTADVVEARAVAGTTFTGPRTSVPRVYSADAAGTGVAWVEVVVREPEPAFRGVVASAWVIAHDQGPPAVVGFEVRRFRDYPGYLTVERHTPLGLIAEGEEHVWVMKRLPAVHDDVRLVAITARGATERLRIVPGGC